MTTRSTGQNWSLDIALARGRIRRPAPRRQGDLGTARARHHRLRQGVRPGQERRDAPEGVVGDRRPGRAAGPPPRAARFRAHRIGSVPAGSGDVRPRAVFDLRQRRCPQGSPSRAVRPLCGPPVRAARQQGAPGGAGLRRQDDLRPAAPARRRRGQCARGDPRTGHGHDQGGLHLRRGALLHLPGRRGVVDRRSRAGADPVRRSDRRVGQLRTGHRDLRRLPRRAAAGRPGPDRDVRHQHERLLGAAGAGRLRTRRCALRRRSRRSPAISRRSSRPPSPASRTTTCTWPATPTRTPSTAT